MNGSLGNRQPIAPRVLMLAERFIPVVGGLERQAHALSRNLAGRGVHVEVVTRRLPRLASFQVHDGIPVHRLPGIQSMGPRRVPFVLGQASFLLLASLFLTTHRHRFNILHVHGLSPSAGPLASVARRLGWTTIVKIATANVGEAGLRRHRLGTLRQRLMRSFDAYIALTMEIEVALRDDGIPASRIYRVPNFVDLEKFRPVTIPERMALRARLWPGLAGETLILLSLSRLEARKGLATLLHAMAGLSTSRPVLLVIAGDGPERRRLEQLADALGLAHRVRFVGTVTVPEEQLQAADLFVLPSIHEGMPNSLLEALAVGLPIAASRIPGVTDVVSQEAAMLVTPNRVEEWRGVLGRLIDSPDMRTSLQQGARAAIEARFGSDTIARKYCELYADLLAQRCTRGGFRH